MLLDSSVSIDSTASTTDPRDNEWQRIDRRLRGYARQRSALDAAEAFDLVRAEQLHGHAICGYAHIYEYMERALGIGAHAARERMRVARTVVGLPWMMKRFAEGELGYAVVRELTRVATDETEEAWVAAAEGKGPREVEELVAGRRKGDLPTDPTSPDLRPRKLSIEVPPEVYALWRQARMAVQEERGSEITEADFVETLCRAVIDPGTGADRPAHQIAYKQCRNCKEATQNGAGREIDVSAEVFERASCDAALLGSLDASSPERATSTVTPRQRAQIFARDDHRCRVPGCRAARNLEIHHIIEQSEGGPHELWNLVLLCGGHHAARHAGLLSITGEAPYGVHFRWRYAPPLPVGLDPEARAAANRERSRQTWAGIDADRAAGTLPEFVVELVPRGTQLPRRRRP